MKRVLVLGAGLVSRPLAHYLTDQEGLEVTVADLVVEKARAVLRGRPRGEALALDIKDAAALASLVARHDLTVSLLPATEHVKVARVCLEHKKHLATTSYIGPEMRGLDGAARAAGLTFLNECGLDPGIDHMSAMRIIDGAKKRGGQVVSFRSYCGGLPAPEANTNPIGYKFSWAPRGVLVAATNAARFLADGAEVNIPGDELFAKPESVTVAGAGAFEGYPNRDSLSYKDLYGLDHARTMFRGTLRHPGHCETWLCWVKAGLFRQEPRTDLAGLTYEKLMASIAGGEGPAREAMAARMGVAVGHPAIQKLDWLGLFTAEPVTVTEGGNVDVMAARMLERCSYAEGERDMIVLQHELEVRYPKKNERVFSTLVAFGTPGGDTAMARTVSLPVAIATRMIASGEITARGVVAPLAAEVYAPILAELERQQIRCEERTA